MQLTVGERLEGSGPEQQPGGYVVTGVVSETPWSGLYTAKKVFYNFDFTAKRVRETDDKEWLDVFLRTIRYPVLDQADYVAERRTLARAEVHAILGGSHSSLWPEPIDLLELEDLRDPFTFVADGDETRDSEPIVVFARPHGQFLPAWLEQILPLSSVLSVLAELLEFMRQAHDEGLLLLGLAPDAVVIDALERVHYVGTDMALAQSSRLLGDLDGTDNWAQFFPPERFPRGFSAPECFRRGGRPDRRSDLYSWGCLAFALLTGESPVKIAQAQGRPWAMFQDEQFNRLESVLTQFPAALRGSWAEQLGLAAASLPSDWPRQLLGVLRLVLSVNSNQRPASVAELRRWLVQLPPPAIAGMVALQLDPGAARLLLDCSNLEPGVRLRIRRGRGRPPADPDDGEAIYEGPAKPIVVDDDLPLTTDLTALFYTAWTDQGSVYSAGSAEELWQPNPTNLRRWAEEHAALSQDGDLIPPRVAMALGALDPAEAAYGLLPSRSPPVRAWGLRRVEQALRTNFRFSLVEPVLWQYLRDPVAPMRQAAALAAWRHAETRNDELLLRLLEALEAPPLDGTPPTANFLAQLNLPDVMVARVLQTLEQRRPTTCPLCSLPIPTKDRLAHLREAHGHVDYDGDAIAYDTAVARLWERVLHRQDAVAHERLLELYLRATPPGATDPPGLARYVDDLQQQAFGSTGGAPVALPFASFEAYLAMLRQCEPFMPLVRLMLLLGDARLRDLGREALLPVLAQKLRGDAISADDVWQALEEACLGTDMLEERLRLCQRLPALGVDAAAVGACALRLQDEKPVRCSECQAAVRSRDIETHLRRVHKVFEFRGTRRSYEATRAAVLRAVCAAQPDLRAWHHLRGMVEDRHPQTADAHLVGWLFQYVRALEAEQRPPALVGLAEVMAASGAGAALLPLFLGPHKGRSWVQIGRRLALELAARMPAPMPDMLLDTVKPLLADTELPRKGRQRAVMALLRTTGRDGPAACALLRAFVTGTGKVRAIEKLHQLEQRFGQAPAIDTVCRELEDEVRMSCPRCPTQLRKKDMVRHLWDRHRLVLDGQRVREPWRVLEDWAVDYGLEKDPELLRRCQELARQVDPEGGPTRLYRLMLRRGMQDRDVLAALVAEAQARAACLCPHCFEFIRHTEPEPPEPLRLEREILEGFGYRVEVGEVFGALPRLRIETPEDVVYDWVEPGRWLTRPGAMVIVGAATVLLLILLNGLTHGTHWFPLLLGAAGGVGLVAGLIYVFWPTPPPRASRLLRAAWDQLVPQILSEPLTLPAYAFLYGLAHLSAESGRRRPRRSLLIQCDEAVAAGAQDDAESAMCLAEITLLQLAVLREAEQDAIGFLAEQLADCFRGQRTLRYFGHVMSELHADRTRYHRGELRRLQVLLAARAFEQGLSADDLLDLARVFPPARDILGLDDRWGWSQLEQLWSLRRARAWEHAGQASHVFELAETPGEAEALLEAYPHLLLSIRPEDLHMTSRGIWVLGQYLAARPDEKAIMWEWSAEDKAYVLEVGSHRLRSAMKPRELVAALKAWLPYYFDDFLPRLPTARRSASEAAQKLWHGLRTSCPECGRPLVACTGDVGIAVR
jgi:hypothetical protein